MPEPRPRFMIAPDDFGCLCQGDHPWFVRPYHTWGDATERCNHVEEAAAYRREYELWRLGRD